MMLPPLGTVMIPPDVLFMIPPLLSMPLFVMVPWFTIVRPRFSDTVSPDGMFTVIPFGMVTLEVGLGIVPPVHVAVLFHAPLDAAVIVDGAVFTVNIVWVDITEMELLNLLAT